MQIKLTLLLLLSFLSAYCIKFTNNYIYIGKTFSSINTAKTNITDFSSKNYFLKYGRSYFLHKGFYLDTDIGYEKVRVDDISAPYEYHFGNSDTFHYLRTTSTLFAKIPIGKYNKFCYGYGIYADIPLGESHSGEAKSDMKKNFEYGWIAKYGIEKDKVRYINSFLVYFIISRSFNQPYKFNSYKLNHVSMSILLGVKFWRKKFLCYYYCYQLFAYLVLTMIVAL